jgi:hypothetical protein
LSRDEKRIDTLKIQGDAGDLVGLCDKSVTAIDGALMRDK